MNLRLAALLSFWIAGLTPYRDRRKLFEKKYNPIYRWALPLVNVR